MPIPQPHGGELLDLVQRDLPQRDQLLAQAAQLPKLELTPRQLCDLELLLNGGFSPLDGFLNEEDYNSVVSDMRLTSKVNPKTGKGYLWPIPITLDVDEATASNLSPGKQIVLVDLRDDTPLAILTVESLYKPNKKLEGEKVFRGDPEHPAVKYLDETAGDWYVGGKLQGLDYPKHYDYAEFRKTPIELRKEFSNLGWDGKKIVAFQTRNPMHRAHRELTIRAADDLGEGGQILIHPVVGLTKPGDIDHHTRVKVYQQILKKFPDNLATLSLLPLAMRMGGDREALWHALIRTNYGVDHFIVGRDHAGPGKNSAGVDFYGPYDAQDLLAQLDDELDIKIVPFRMVTYLPDEDRYAPIDTIDTSKVKTANISGTELRNRLRTGEEIPEWFSYPEVVKILRDSNPPRLKQGFVIAIDNGDKTGDYLGFALEATLNQFPGRKITKIDATKYDSFIIGELVRAGAGVITTGPKAKIDEVVATVGSGNSIVPEGVDAQNLDVALNSIVGSLTEQGFY